MRARMAKTTWLFSLLVVVWCIEYTQAQIVLREEINRMMNGRQATYVGCGEIIRVNMTPGSEGYGVHIEHGSGIDMYFFIGKTEDSKWLHEGAFIDVYLLPEVNHRILPVKSCDRTFV